MGRLRPGHNAGRKPLYKEFRLSFVEPSAEAQEAPLKENNGFLFSAAVKGLTLERACSLDEIGARDTFKAIRWPLGEPKCPACGGKHRYWFKHRGGYRTWECFDCAREFSVTSGTVFASHKISVRSLLIAIAVTVGASPAQNQTDAAQAIGITQKASHALISKLCELAAIPVPPADREFEIGRPRYMGGLLMNTRTWWEDREKEALSRFIESGYSAQQVAPVLGRSETSMAWYARDKGIVLPASWNKLIAQKRASTADPRIHLSYPYIISKRPEHADLLAINDLVPKSYPPEMRADICQEMMLAILEGRTTIDEIKANRSKAAWFLKKFWMANYEQSGRAVSLTGHEDDDRSYDEVASSIAAKDWYTGEVAKRQRHINGQHVGRFQPPVQLEELYHKQINYIRGHFDQKGKNYTFGEVEDIIDNDDYKPALSNGHAGDRSIDRYGLTLSYSDKLSIASRIRNGEALLIEEESDAIALYHVAHKGRNLPVVWNRLNGRIITILPPGGRLRARS